MHHNSSISSIRLSYAVRLGDYDTRDEKLKGYIFSVLRGRISHQNAMPRQGYSVSHPGLQNVDLKYDYVILPSIRN